MTHEQLPNMTQKEFKLRRDSSHVSWWLAKRATIRLSDFLLFGTAWLPRLGERQEAGDALLEEAEEKTVRF